MGITGEAIATRSRSAAKETTKRQAQPEADPIYAVIEAYKQAKRESAASYDRFGGDLGGPLAWREAYLELTEACDAAEAGLATTKPTTIGGVVALLELFQKDSPWTLGNASWHPGAIQNAIAALKAARTPAAA